MDRLFRPQSYGPSGSSLAMAHSQDGIRANTMRLSGVAQPFHQHPSSPLVDSPHSSTHHDTYQRPNPNDSPTASSPRHVSGPPAIIPSGLSLLLARQGESTPMQGHSPDIENKTTSSNSITTPERGRSRFSVAESTALLHGASSLPSYIRNRISESLSPSNSHSSSESSMVRSLYGGKHFHQRFTTNLQDAFSPTRIRETVQVALQSIPAVLLGMLLNILDGVSYGMIAFPSTGVFSDAGGMGVSMFFVSTIAAQLVYTFGGSGFAGANGSMMIEVVVRESRLA